MTAVYRSTCRGWHRAIRGSWYGAPLFVPRFKALDSYVVRQKSHLLDCDLVQLAEPLCLQSLFLDEKGIQRFQIGEANKLRHIRVVSNIALIARMAVAPLLGGHAE